MGWRKPTINHSNIKNTSIFDLPKMPVYMFI